MKSAPRPGAQVRHSCSAFCGTPVFRVHPCTRGTATRDKQLMIRFMLQCSFLPLLACHVANIIFGHTGRAFCAMSPKHRVSFPTFTAVCTSRTREYPSTVKCRVVLLGQPFVRSVTHNRKFTPPPTEQKETQCIRSIPFAAYIELFVVLRRRMSLYSSTLH
jgi:hypothetical protein